MICPACGTDYPSASRACPGCGAPKPRFCSECGAPLVLEAKFCSECGTRVAEAQATPAGSPGAAATAPASADRPGDTGPGLAGVASVEPATLEPTHLESPVVEPPLPPELRQKFESVRAELSGERREVAVLFADMSGFTAMSEKLDPEETSLLMNRLLNSLAEQVYRYEGYVDKYIGDAIMALFGAPLAHENDPERAVLAGLGMLEVIERYNRTAEVPLAIRVGINLGEVVAAHLGTGMRLQYTVMGDTVNVASRLEGKATPNTILVSEALFDRVASRFRAEKLPPLEVKGKREPIQTFRILSFESRGRLTTRAASPFVGRESELAALGSFIERVGRGQGGTIMVEADAGAGKSRLVQEALARSTVEAQAVEIAFSPVRLPGQRPPLAEIFYQLLPEEPHGGSAADRALALLGDQAAAHRSGIEDLAREADPSAEVEVAEDVDPKLARQRRWLATLALIRATAAVRPVLLHAEDVHWMDEATQEFFDLLARTIGDEPVGALLTSRPRAAGAWLPPGAARIVLPPLDARSAEVLLGGLLEGVGVNRRELIRRSEGNPLFLEELARALRQSAAEGRPPESVPGTLQGLLVSRIDRLDPPVRLLLQMGAVLGFRFPTRLLGRMYGLDPQPLGFDPALRLLEEEGLLEPEVNGEVRHRFHHALLQEAAYKGLLIRIRKVLHESAARLGEEHYAEGRDAEAAFFAHHYWEAGLPHEAAPHLWVAGRRAAEQYDLPAGERFLERAAEALAAHPDVLPEVDDRARLRETLGEVLLHRGKLDAADVQFRAFEELADAEGRQEWKTGALRQRGRVAWYRGDLDRARGLFEEGLTHAPGDRMAADIYSNLGIVYYYRGKAEEAFENHERALELRRRLGDDLGIVKSLVNVGNILLHFRDDLAGAEARYERALEIARKLGNRMEASLAINNLGYVAMERGDWERAMSLFRQAAAMEDEIGWSFLGYVVLQNQTLCEIAVGRLEEALAHLRVCLEQGDRFLEPMNRINTRFYQFDALIRALADDRAEAALEEARRLVNELGVEEQEEELALREGRLLAARAQWGEAADAFRRAEEAARRLNHPPTEKLARAQRCRAQARAGETEVESCPVDDGGRPPLVALVRYLNADAEAARQPSQETAQALATAGEEAAQLGEIGLERAAFERQAEVLRAIGDVVGAETARVRAAAALAELAGRLPIELRPGFSTHGRNTRLGEPVRSGPAGSEVRD